MTIEQLDERVADCASDLRRVDAEIERQQAVIDQLREQRHNAQRNLDAWLLHPDRDVMCAFAYPDGRCGLPQKDPIHADQKKPEVWAKIERRIDISYTPHTFVPDEERRRDTFTLL